MSVSFLSGGLLGQLAFPAEFTVDIAAWVPVIATGLTGIIAAVVGLYFVLRVTQAGMRWVTRWGK